MPVFQLSSTMPVSADALFAWHLRPGAFPRLAPPWESIELLEGSEVSEGSLARIRMRIGPLPREWVARHHDLIPGRQFCDSQISGPFAKWEHTHSMMPSGTDQSVLTDRIEYQPPLGVLGNRLGSRLIHRQLQRTFAWRHEVTCRDLAFHAQWGTAAMKIAIGGSTGMVGSALVSFLTTGGHSVLRLSRATSARNADGHVADGTASIAWNPALGTIDAAALEGVDAVVHLGGHNIAHGRWTEGNKRLIRDSRLLSTSLLSQTLAGLKNPPKVFVCASAIGYYGDRGDDIMTENSPPGPRFISDLCRDWEAATQPARDAGIRVINLRIGVVLSPQGGALRKMLLPFQLGAGGIVGNGRQWMSWVSLEDLPRIILHCLHHEELSGPVNAVAPELVTNRQFTKTLGRVLHRPTLFPLPALAVKFALGEMGEELLLGSTRVIPTKLQESGYQFAHPEIEPALRALLGKEQALRDQSRD